MLLSGSVPISSLSSTPTIQTVLLSSFIIGPSAGLNSGRVISSVCFSKTTSTGMSQRSFLGSASKLIRFVSIRGPSSSSTMASTTGVFTLKALLRIWCAISKEKSLPRPLAWIHAMSREVQNGQSTRG